MKFVSILMTVVVSHCLFAQEKAVAQMIEKSSYNLESFGYMGLEQLDLFGDPISEQWYLKQPVPNAEAYNFRFDRSYVIGKNLIDSDKLSMVSLENPQADTGIAVVARLTNIKNPKENQRFLIKLDPLETKKINFLQTSDGSVVRFYSMAPFLMHTENKNHPDEKRTVSQLRMPMNIEPPDNICDETPDDPDGCFNFRVTLPHCVRVVGEFTGVAVLASMRTWFECPNGVENGADLFEYIEIFYPTREDLFHKALYWTVPKCNPGLTTSEEQNAYRESNSFAFTENVNDAAKRHKWKNIYNVVWKDEEGHVDCVGTASCTLGFTYEKHFTCN